jgi:hypothetical protein
MVIRRPRPFVSTSMNRGTFIVNRNNRRMVKANRVCWASYQLPNTSRFDQV